MNIKTFRKRLYYVLGRPVISNCVTPTEKASEFLGNQLKGSYAK